MGRDGEEIQVARSGFRYGLPFGGRVWIWNFF